MTDLHDRESEINSILTGIGTQVSDYRKKANITQIQLSKLSHVPQSSIARIENGQNTSSLTLAKLVAAMNKDMELKVVR